MHQGACNPATVLMDQQQRKSTAMAAYRKLWLLCRLQRENLDVVQPFWRTPFPTEYRAMQSFKCLP